MKNLMIFLTVFCFLVSGVANASTIGSVETNGKGKIAVESDFDYIFNREMEADTLSRDLIASITVPPIGLNFFLSQSTEVQNADIDHYYRAGGKISYGLLENLDIYALLGAAGYRMNMDYHGSLQTNVELVGLAPPPGLSLDFPGSMRGEIKYETNDALVWGFGCKGVYEFNDDWLAGLDFSYLHHKSEYTADERAFMTIDGIPPALGINFSDIPVEFRYNGELTLQEVKAAPYIAKKFGDLVPYVGAVFTWIWMKDEGHSSLDYWTNPIAALAPGAAASAQFYRGNRLRYSAKYNIGCFGGFNYKIGSHWIINLEGRFIDETAVSGGVKFVW